MSERVNTTPEETQRAVARKRLEAKGKRAVEKKFQTLEKLKIEYLGINDVTPNEYNPNRQSEHDFELLCRSIEEDGFTQPIIVTVDGNKIVDGEHRWRAAKTLGFTTIPVVKVDMTPEQMRISTIRHNRARGSHDLELEAQVLRDLQSLGAIDWAQDSLMLDDVELNRLLNDVAAPESMAAEEFSEAWVPDSLSDEDRALVRDGIKGADATTRDTSKGVVQTAMSSQAIDLQRRREELIKQAKTEEERKKVEADTRIFRVSLIFTSDEADDVKAVLGNRPAENLLALCREQRARTPSAEGARRT